MVEFVNIKLICYQLIKWRTVIFRIKTAEYKIAKFFNLNIIIILNILFSNIWYILLTLRRKFNNIKKIISLNKLLKN